MLKVFPRIDLGYYEHLYDKPCMIVYFCGCSIKCKNCHNPDLQKFNNPLCVEIEPKDLVKKLEFYRNETGINEVIIMGGEPQDQNKESMLEFLKLLKEKGFIITFYTGYDEVDKRFLSYLDYLKVGRYIEELKTNEGKLASKNQKFLDLR